MSSTTPTKKRRLGGLFSSQKDDIKPTPKAAHAQGSDSGYGGSSRSASSNNADITPIENHGQVSGVSEQRNLAVNQRTGEVVDDDTGEVLTTVTTTTTTTTTTIRRSKSPQPQTAEAQQSNGAAPPQQFLSPETAMQQARSHSPGPAQRPPELQHLAPPDVPPRSKSRDSGEQQRRRGSKNVTADNTIPPVPPEYYQRYPSRSPVQNQRQSGFQNLKDAAVGLHGVGETLRGTINSGVDSRFPRRDAGKATAANTNNESTLQRGREEMARLHQTRSRTNMQNAQGVQSPPGQSSWQAPPAWGAPDQAPTFTTPPPNESLKKRKSLSSMPGTFYPESSGQTEEKEGGVLKRILKGRSPGPS